jgi:HlyD family secretion protein
MSASLALRHYQRAAGIAAFGFAALLVVATFGIRISGGVTSEGQMIQSGENLVLQHLDGGLVAAVFVSDGETVAAGAPLLRLDGTELIAQNARLTRERLELDVRLARLQAALTGASSFAAPVLRGRDGASADTADIIRTQSEALKAERAALAAEVNRAARRAEGADAARADLRGQVDANIARQALIDREITDLTVLVDEQLVTRTRLTALQREALDIRQRLEALKLEDTRLQTEAAAARLDRTSLARRDTDELWREVEEAQRERARIGRELEATGARLGRLTLTAPAGGRVHELRVRNVGAAIDPGGLVMQIVPQDSAHQIRVRINPSDIDALSIGQKARLRFDTFETTGAPEFIGNVSSIAADRSSDIATGAPYYAVRIDVTGSERGRLARLNPGTGAPVTVLIETRKRSLAAYLVAPVAKAFSRMFEG